jgi:hypothetical protein
VTFDRKVRAVPKPEGGKKSKSKGTTKTVDMSAVDEKRQRQNNINRNFGKAVERNVAKLTEGSRVPMSGAIKNSVHNLEGDVQVRSPDGKRVLALIECKGTAGISPKGDKVFSLKKSVLDQMKKEGRLQHALPATWIHWKDANYTQDDYVIIPAEDFLKLLEALKELYTLEYIEGESS